MVALKDVLQICLRILEARSALHLFSLRLFTERRSGAAFVKLAVARVALLEHSELGSISAIQTVLQHLHPVNGPFVCSLNGIEASNSTAVQLNRAGF